MQHSSRKSLLTLLAVVLTVFTSCKKEFSKDDPFPDEFTPTIFIGSQNEFLYALDPQTGDKKWEFKTDGNIHASPLVMGNYLFVGTQRGTVYKLDAKYGTVKNTYNFGAGEIYSTPTGADNFIYYGRGSHMIAVDIDADTLEWMYGAVGEIRTSGVVYDTLCIFGSTNGQVYAVDRIDAASLVWSYISGGDDFYSSPAIEDSLLFIGSSRNGGAEGAMHAVRLSNGTVQWRYPTPGAVLSSPAAYSGNVIFGCNDYKLYCLDITSGQPRWNPLATKDRIVSSPYAYNQVIFAGSYDYKMYAVNIIDGTLLWEYQTDAIIRSSPMVYDNKLYFGSHDKYLYCLDIHNGDKIWKQLINGLIECSPVVDNLDGKSTYTSSVSGNSIY